MTLNIAKGLKIPDDAVTQTIGVVASRGSGKTYLTAVLGEEMIGAGLPVCALDPIGVYWGWRSSADGKREGLPVVILGGEHADAPLEASAGKVIADWVVEERRPCVLDLSLFRKGEQRVFVTDFAEQLYRKNREPLHLILDEADLFAPQRPMPGEQRMLGAIEDLVRRGRARGLGLTLVTQRPAVIHKDVLTQVSVLVALRMLGPQDRDAVDAWIKFHGDGSQRKTVLESLPSLPIGTAWFWSPGWLGILQKVQIRKRETFDSSSTPAVGSKRVVPQKIAPVDLKALSSKIASTIERAKAEDPKALRARIAELERQLAAKPVVDVDVQRVEVPMLNDPALQAIAIMAHQAEGFAEQARALHEKVDAFAVRVERKPAPPMRPAAPSVPKPRPSMPTNGASSGAGERMPKAERQILTALAQHGPLSLTQAAIIAGYSSKSGGMRNAAGWLRSGNYATGGNDRLTITPKGEHALGQWTPLPTGRALAEHWFRQLPKAEREILAVVVHAYPDPVSLHNAAVQCGYAPSSGGMRNAAGKLRTLDLVEGGNDGMRANERIVD